MSPKRVLLLVIHDQLRIEMLRSRPILTEYLFMPQLATRLVTPYKSILGINGYDDGHFQEGNCQYLFFITSGITYQNTQ